MGPLENVMLKIGPWVVENSDGTWQWFRMEVSDKGVIERYETASDKQFKRGDKCKWQDKSDFPHLADGCFENLCNIYKSSEYRKSHNVSIMDENPQDNLIIFLQMRQADSIEQFFKYWKNFSPKDSDCIYSELKRFILNHTNVNLRQLFVFYKWPDLGFEYRDSLARAIDFVLAESLDSNTLQTLTTGELRVLLSLPLHADNLSFVVSYLESHADAGELFNAHKKFFNT